ncbi:MAG TPA: hypothetical protein VM032_16405 [Vicinamibacterales bacterium]|nr:hypothetical protein [Vicinamibacterales bacterium]
MLKTVRLQSVTEFRISRCSLALANFQSRMTVSIETPSTVAVSSTLNPPKKRKSMTFVLRGSDAAHHSRRPRQEVRTVLPVDTLRVDQTDVGLARPDPSIHFGVTRVL